jgi:phytanoyl-CoA hydroxylase
MNTDDIVDHYNRHGYVTIPGLLSADDLARLRGGTDRISALAVGQTEDNGMFDFERGHTPENPKIQRIKKPHRIDPLYVDMAAHAGILAVVSKLIGNGIRLSHSKINMKAAALGAPLEWHQDWAFAPHTNMSTCVASVLIDDSDLSNGATQVVPGSHKGKLFNHHDEENFFVGAIPADDPELDLSGAVPLAGPAGTVAFHHPMIIHGSSANRSGRPRRVLFLEYSAIDAFPLFYDVDWSEYNSRIVAGGATSEVRFESNYVKLPFPSRVGFSIYKAQVDARSKFFEAAI